MEEQERYEQQSVNYRVYISALGTKFDSLPIEQRGVALGKIETLLAGVLRLEKDSTNYLSDGDERVSSFNHERAREVRLEQKLTQKILGKLLGIDQTTISRWESGVTSFSGNGLKGRKYLNWLHERGYENGN